MTNISQKIAENLLQINAIKLNPQNPFIWASGIKSPIYCDNRITLSYPEIRTFIKESFAKLSADLDFDIIVGVATAGIPHGALLADYLNLPFAYVRSSHKAHGRKNQIEGEIKSGQKALVIEDLISTGGSSIKGCKVLQENKVEIARVMAIFNYGFEKAVNNFNSAGISFITLSNYETLLEIALATGFISQEDKSLLDSWNKDPDLWYDNQMNKK
jgi:orotate phosphoribosyltransferase